MHSKLFENELPGELPEVARDAPVTRGIQLSTFFIALRKANNNKN